jgi:hypothetical protein
MILAFAGRKHSGKSTICKHLVSNYGYIQVSFANELKNMMCYVLGLNRAGLEDAKNQESYNVTLNKSDIEYISSKTEIPFSVIKSILDQKALTVN